MCSPSRSTRFVAAVIAALALTACASMTVNSYLERGIDFTRYRTYNFTPTDSASTGDPRLDNNRFFHERVQADVEKQMAARGFEKTAAPNADLLIHYHASITQEIDVNDIDRESGYCRTNDCRPYVYDAGTLLFDFVDRRTRMLVWRGWAKGSMDRVLDSQEWMEQKIDDAVTRILARLPGNIRG